MSNKIKEKYLLMKNNDIFINESNYLLLSNQLENIIDKSDNILDLAREGDLVMWFGRIFELYLDEGQLIFYSDCYTQWLEETRGTKNITMLYKKVGDDFIGYKVE